MLLSEIKSCAVHPRCRRCPQFSEARHVVMSDRVESRKTLSQVRGTAETSLLRTMSDTDIFVRMRVVALRTRCEVGECWDGRQGVSIQGPVQDRVLSLRRLLRLHREEGTQAVMKRS